MPTKKGRLARGAQSDPGYQPAKNRDIDFTGRLTPVIPSDAVLNQWEGMFARDEKGESAASALKLTIDAVRELKKQREELLQEISSLSSQEPEEEKESEE